MKNEKHQDHHVIPVSLLGHDWPENIVRLTVSDHELLHKVLNLPYQKIRKFRLKTNHMVYRNSQEFVRELKTIHLAFFQNINMLPIRLQNLLRNSVRDQVERIIKEHRIELKLPQYNASLFKWLNSYHYILILR